MKWTSVGFILVISVNIAHADVAGRADAQCKQRPNGNTKCILTYDLNDNPRRHYQLHALDNDLLVWRSVATPKKARGKLEVRPETLYRVLACDDRDYSLNCVSSSATWAPSLRPLEEIPPEMEIMDSDGTTMKVGFASGDSQFVLLAQYNVYVLSDLVNRVVLADSEDLPEMLPPIEMVETTHRSLDHQIAHNSHSIYEGARSKAKN